MNGNGSGSSGNGGGGTGAGANSLADYVVLQHVTTHKSLHGTGQGGLWLRSTDGSEPRLLKEGDVISRADFDRVYWADDGNAGGEFQFVASNAQGEPVAHATPHVCPSAGTSLRLRPNTRPARSFMCSTMPSRPWKPACSRAPTPA